KAGLIIAAGLMLAVLAALGSALMPAVADTQEYPSRNVTIIVPYPAGGPTDETARMVAQSLSRELKQSFIVEDIGGGGSIIGSEKVARATPDGYTLLVHNLQIAANVSLYENLPFDTVKTFTPVMLINRNPLVLVGRKTLEPTRLGDLVALMKQQRLKAAIPGYGTTGHLATTLFAQEAGVALDQIPYRGAAPAVTDLLGGQVDLFFATPPSVVQQVTTGALKAYGVTSKEKLAEFPTADSIPLTFGPKLDVVYWQAMFAPAQTPALVVEKLSKALQNAVADPALVKIWAAEDVSVFPPDQRSPAAASALLNSEIARWGQVIRDNKIRIQQ
ncbi:MAG: tripartite tricarboxylate transporter substrate binding protein BugD, partial [Rhizobiales bacterium]|nr:tripartite tricarboxylate transporter substrate binding protein BugD [Hyphomicrobiales bacterium]